MVTPSLICFTPRKEELLTIVTELSSKVLNMLSITLLPKKIKNVRHYLYHKMSNIV